MDYRSLGLRKDKPSLSVSLSVTNLLFVFGVPDETAADIHFELPDSDHLSVVPPSVISETPAAGDSETENEQQPTTEASHADNHTGEKTNQFFLSLYCINREFHTQSQTQN